MSKPLTAMVSPAASATLCDIPGDGDIGVLDELLVDQRVLLVELLITTLSHLLLGWLGFRRKRQPAHGRWSVVPINLGVHVLAHSAERLRGSDLHGTS